MTAHGTTRRSQHQYGSSHWLPDWKRLAIYLRDGFLCQYCGRNCARLRPASVHLDHLQPRSKGGSHNNDTPDYAPNLVTACGSCNGARKDRPWRQYATGGAIERILRTRRRKLNGALAKSIMRGEQPDPRKES